MQQLEQYQYLLLKTLKRNGDWVATPVWFASDDEYHYVFSAANVGKVKRLRNFSDVKIAGCTVTGKPLSEDQASNAFLIDDPACIQQANHCLNKKYGWQKSLLDMIAKLGKKYDKRQYIKIKKSNNN